MLVEVLLEAREEVADLFGVAEVGHGVVDHIAGVG